MSNHISIDDFSPLSIASGDSIEVDFTYTADTDGFIVVNESLEFDAVPGRIEIMGGTSLSRTVSIQLTRQPAASAHECRVTLTLAPASHTILVHVK